VQLVAHKRTQCSAKSVKAVIRIDGEDSAEIQRLQEQLNAMTKVQSMTKANLICAKDLVEKSLATIAQLKAENAEMRQAMLTMHDTLSRVLDLSCQKKRCESRRET
jgi:uncharacterized protein YPO0396